MPCNSCIPPPPIFDIPPPPDPSLILHLLIEDIQQQQHSLRPQQFYSCLKPSPFPSFLSKLLFGADWLLPFLAIFLFCIFTIFVGLIILIRKRRKKREEEEMRRRRTQNNGGGEKKKKLNRKR
ncbi:unnamed protein product [Meloidogyne enterolobii]|uniref:Uncharacterized protein n=1 Tax=Meloidogyne enterolobii TaxID=390850 RepID=A0ACB0Y1I6_MELEN